MYDVDSICTTTHNYWTRILKKWSRERKWCCFKRCCSVSIRYCFVKTQLENAPRQKETLVQNVNKVDEDIICSIYYIFLKNFYHQIFLSSSRPCLAESIYTATLQVKKTKRNIYFLSCDGWLIHSWITQKMGDTSNVYSLIYRQYMYNELCRIFWTIIWF